jgi:hypothetical protein
MSAFVSQPSGTACFWFRFELMRNDHPKKNSVQDDDRGSRRPETIIVDGWSSRLALSSAPKGLERLGLPFLPVRGNGRRSVLDGIIPLLCAATTDGTAELRQLTTRLDVLTIRPRSVSQNGQIPKPNTSAALVNCPFASNVSVVRHHGR